MKRLLLSLGIAVMSALFALNQPALAQIPTGCSTVAIGSTTPWPGYVYSLNCAGTAGNSDASTMESAAGQNAPGAAYNNLAGSASHLVNAGYYSTGLYLFLFQTPAAYKTALGSDAATVPAGAFAVTKFDSNNVPMHIAVFRQNSAGTDNPSIGSATVYQVGVALDSLLGYVTTDGVLTYPNPTVSPTTGFGSEYTYDWKQINAITPQCGNGGLFTGQTDPSKSGTVYICDGTDGQGSGLNSGYSGKTNQAILAQILPGSFGSQSALWAQEYEEAYGPLVSPIYYYMGKGFSCSTKYQNIMVNYGRNPQAADFNGSSCPTTSLPAASDCTRVFSSLSGRVEGQFGFGNVFDCGTGQGSNIANQMDKLGTLNSSSVTTATQQTLKSANTYLYLFPTTAAYNTIFKGRVQLDTGIGSNPGTTLHYHNAAYSAVIQQPTGLKNPLDEQDLLEVSDHELGHGVDIALSYQSGSSLFGLATQNDLINLDFTVVGSSQTNSTRRNPCQLTGYTGPLVGVIDPSTITQQNPNGSPYCSNGVLNNPNKYGATLIHLILRPLGGGSVTTYTAKGPLGDQTYPGGWAENFAQSYRDEAVGDTGGDGLSNELDGVVANGYFPCSAHNGYLAYIYTGTYTITAANLPSSCSTAVPAWFTTLLKTN